MTSFGITLFTAALQVTVAALIASAIVMIAARRSPRHGAGLAVAALGLCSLLSLAAIATVPDWWTWDKQRLRAETQPNAAAEQEPTARPSDTGGLAIPFHRLVRLLPSAGTIETDRKPQWNAWSIIAAVFLAGVAFELVRLAAGLFAVAAIRRRSVPVANLTAEMEELCQCLGVKFPVTVRQSAAVGTAATLGWWRPVILLAADWPTWEVTERRAVLAHELAHVRRRDYLVGVFGAIARAFHFYHPLVRWLAGRLGLHQELAADGLAAAVAGGRADYLRALSRMALRQDAALVAGVARPFLSDRTGLMRRIAMLRVTDGGRPLSRAARWGMGGILVAAALAASALRRPGEPPAAVAPANEVPPFDISHVPASANQLFAIRPAAVLARAGTKTIADRFSWMLAENLKAAGFPSDVSVPVQEIEQIVVALEGKKLPPPSGNERKVEGPQQVEMLSTVLIRMTHDFDWSAVIRSGATALKAAPQEVRPGLFRVTAHNLFLHFQVVDPRTLCLLAGEGLPRVTTEELLAQMKPAADPAAAWGPAWPKANRSAAVMAFDNRKAFWTSISGPSRPGPNLLTAIGQPGNAIGCLDLADNVTAHVYVTADEHVAGQKRANLEDLAAQLLSGFRRGSEPSGVIATSMLNHRTITRDGNTDIAELRLKEGGKPVQLANLLLMLDLPHAGQVAAAAM